MTVKEFAERAAISQGLAYELIAEGAIQHRRIGLKGTRGTIRITEEDFSAYMESTKVGPKAPSPAPAPRVKYRHLPPR